MNYFLCSSYSPYPIIIFIYFSLLRWKWFGLCLLISQPSISLTIILPPIFDIISPRSLKKSLSISYLTMYLIGLHSCDWKKTTKMTLNPWYMAKMGGGEIMEGSHQGMMLSRDQVASASIVLVFRYSHDCDIIIRLLNLDICIAVPGSWTYPSPYDNLSLILLKGRNPQDICISYWQNWVTWSPLTERKVQYVWLPIFHNQEHKGFRGLVIGPRYTFDRVATAFSYIQPHNLFPSLRCHLPSQWSSPPPLIACENWRGHFWLLKTEYCCQHCRAFVPGTFQARIVWGIVTCHGIPIKMGGGMHFVKIKSASYIIYHQILIVIYFICTEVNILTASSSSTVSVNKWPLISL